MASLPLLASRNPPTLFGSNFFTKFLLRPVKDFGSKQTNDEDLKVFDELHHFLKKLQMIGNYFFFASDNFQISYLI